MVMVAGDVFGSCYIILVGFHLMFLVFPYDLVGFLYALNLFCMIMNALIYMTTNLRITMTRNVHNYMTTSVQPRLRMCGRNFRRSSSSWIP